MNIAVFGLGKLGSPLAALLASCGHRVVGVDNNAQFVNGINMGIAPVVEPGLAELLAECEDGLSATANGVEAAAAADAIFIIVPTPSTPEGDFSTEYVSSAIRTIGHGLANNGKYQIVVLVSTVCPGVMDRVVVPELEAASGKKTGHDYGVLYNPEFIALGSVLENMMCPDFILIGESDQKAGDALVGIYDTMHDELPTVKRMSFVNAELTKLAVNSFVTTKISYANMIAGLCEQLPHSDAAVVLDAIGCDTRIGHKYLQPATAFGGPCFPRDSRALLTVARQVGVPAELATATDSINARTRERLVCNVLKIAAKAGGTVGILGLSYKPNTPVVEESAALDLASRLADFQIKTVVYDPEAMPNARAVLGDRVGYAATPAQCIDKSDVVVVATAWTEFSAISPDIYARPGQRRVVLDLWRLLDANKMAEVVEYITPGTFG